MIEVGMLSEYVNVWHRLPARRGDPTEARADSVTNMPPSCGGEAVSRTSAHEENLRFYGTRE